MKDFHNTRVSVFEPIEEKEEMPDISAYKQSGEALPKFSSSVNSQINFLF